MGEGGRGIVCACVLELYVCIYRANRGEEEEEEGEGRDEGQGGGWSALPDIQHTTTSPLQFDDLEELMGQRRWSS